MAKNRSEPNSVFSLVFFFLIIWLSFFPVPTYYCSWKIILIILSINTAFLFYLRGIKIKFLFARSYDFILWLYLAYVASGFFYGSDKKAFELFYLLYFLPIPLLYYSFKSEFSKLKNKNIHLLVLSFCVLAASCLAIAEYVFRHNFIYEHLVQNVFYTHFSGYRRSMSTQFVPSVLATYLASCLALSYYFFFCAKRLIARIAWLISALVIWLGIITTCTRGVFLAAFISSAMYAFFKSKKMLLVVLSSFMILFTLLSFNLPMPSLNRLGLRSIAYGVDPRLERWSVALNMSRDHPLRGIGLGQYKMYFDQYSDLDFSQDDKNAENMFLTILAESGTPALIFFILFLFYLFADVFRQLRRKEANSALLLTFSACLLTISLSMFFTLDALYWPSLLYLFWIFCGIIASLLNNHANNQIQTP